MTPERWQQVKEIFNSAISCAPEDRSVFLAQACSGDEHLRTEVESLIRSHEKSGEFIDQAAYLATSSFVEEKTTLKPGESIGSYDIISFLSRGGMGEVYLAQDRRLNRKVALKVLPAFFTQDPNRLARFEQEARSASALNHPNIVTIYEVFEANSTHLMATEFVEGQTLRQRQRSEPLGLAEALTVAIQIADALAAAHKIGIVHRDIKPENIMLREDGYVKVLDFGLAKLTDTSAGLSLEAPTMKVRTGSGMVMGTAGYMSPEQARGLAIDARSDIFSFGAVVYELISNRKPFDGDTPSDIMAAVLTAEPRPLAQIVPGLPPELVRIVNKSLRKDREERYQVIKDLLLDLKALKQELEFQAQLEQSTVPERSDTLQASISPSTALTDSGITQETRESAVVDSNVTESISVATRPRRFRTLILIGVVAALGLAGFGLFRFLNQPSGRTPFQKMEMSRLTNSGKAIDAAISPDGKYLVYVMSDAGKQSLWIRQVTAANDTQILPPAEVGFFGLAFSKDGNNLYYSVKANLNQGILYRIPVLGGTPVKILERIDSPVSFSPDGKQFAWLRSNYPGPEESSLMIANADGGDERVLAKRKLPELVAPIFFGAPAWSPDGQLVATSVITLGSPTRVIAFSVSDGKESVFTSRTWPFISRVEWLPDMSGILAIAGDTRGESQVWFMPYPEGEPSRITNDLNMYRALALTAGGGQLATIQVASLVNIWVAPDGDARRAVQLPTGNIGFYSAFGNSLSFTPDQRIVFVANEGGSSNIWVMDADGSNRKQLTSQAGLNFNPVVSADGRFLVFTSRRTRRAQLWRMNIDGSDLKKLTDGLEDSNPVISPDGKWIIYVSLHSGQRTLWKLPIEGGPPVSVFEQNVAGPAISPDGKQIAVFVGSSSDPTAPPNQIAIIPFEGGPVTRTFSFQISGTITPVLHWSPDGQSLHYTVSNNNVTNVWSQPVAGGPPKQLTNFTDSLMTGFSWSRDGKLLVCSRGQLFRDAVLITDSK